MKDLEEIKMGDLRGAVKALNDTGLLEEKIRVAGVKKEELVKKFVEELGNMEEGTELPTEVVDFYNELPENIAGDPDPEPEKEKKKDKLKKETKKAPAKAKVKSFDDLKLSLKEPANATQFFDKLTIRGGKIPTLIERLTDEYPDHKSLSTPSAVKAHIAYREKRGYVYETKGEDNIKLVDLK